MLRPTPGSVIGSAPSSFLACLIAGAVLAGAAPEASASGILDQATFNDIAAALHRLADVAGSWIMAGYRRSPALMAGLSGILLLPLLVVVGIILRQLVPTHDPGWQRIPVADTLPRTAWLELAGNEGDRAKTMPINRELLQLGREEDNDICILDDTVHRYHALIECSPDNGFIITDVSGPEGSGVVVNGERLLKSSLSDGDVVELGQVRFTFSCRSGVCADTEFASAA